MTNALINHTEYLRYLPDKDNESNHFSNRDYFFGVIGTFYPDYMTKVIENANRNRI
jgi:hypothetical protein